MEGIRYPEKALLESGLFGHYFYPEVVGESSQNCQTQQDLLLQISLSEVDQGFPVRGGGRCLTRALFIKNVCDVREKERIGSRWSRCSI